MAGRPHARRAARSGASGDHSTFTEQCSSGPGPTTSFSVVSSVSVAITTNPIEQTLSRLHTEPYQDTKNLTPPNHHPPNA